jgi:hypothetical protein
MIRIHFSDPQTEARALGFLASRFSCKTFDDGTTLVPEAALAPLAAQGIPFSVGGRAVYEQVVPALRDASAADVQ